jgi:hypothetical protein
LTIGVAAAVAAEETAGQQEVIFAETEIWMKVGRTMVGATREMMLQRILGTPEIGI